MKNSRSSMLAALFTVSLFFQSCSVIGEIFKTGVWTGIILVVVVIIVVVGIFARRGK